jgi:hypothetical protein
VEAQAVREARKFLPPRLFDQAAAEDPGPPVEMLSRCRQQRADHRIIVDAIDMKLCLHVSQRDRRDSWRRDADGREHEYLRERKERPEGRSLPSGKFGFSPELKGCYDVTLIFGIRNIDTPAFSKLVEFAAGELLEIVR